ncbi:DUF2891 family protein [Sorangium sp. So ce1151]
MRARLLATCAGIPPLPRRPGAAPVRALLDAQLTGEKVVAELGYLRRPSSRGFERPYGWAWLLLLAAELERQDTEEGRRWSAALAPLGDALRARRHRGLVGAGLALQRPVHRDIHGLHGTHTSAQPGQGAVHVGAGIGAAPSAEAGARWIACHGSARERAGWVKL